MESNVTGDGVNRTAKMVTPYQPNVPCNEASSKQSPDTFYKECCLKVESLVALSNPLCTYQSLLRRMTPSATAPTSVIVEDISDMGRDFDNIKENTKDDAKTSERNKTMDVYFEELNSDVSSWKQSYYTVLGFFIVFLLIFLIVVGFLVFKLRGSKVRNIFWTLDHIITFVSRL